MVHRRSPSHRLALTSLFAATLGCSGAAPGAATLPAPDAPRPGCLLRDHTSDNPDPKQFGAWNTVVPKAGGGAIGSVLGMQTVHTILLPSGKILLASGSSWRNLAPVQYYPEYPNPAQPTGIFVANQKPFENDKLSTYYQLVNNVGIYDPEENTFYRVPHPVPMKDPSKPGHFVANDLFCTGQQHLPDGNVLFTGGTQYYSPFRTGNKSTYIFDWRQELGIPWEKVDWRQIPGPSTDPWIFSGFMERGRWYASLVPLLDGRLAIFSGFVDYDADEPDKNKQMYQFEINHLVEFFDPSQFDRKNPQAAWRSIDVKRAPNSPFTTKINDHFKPSPGVTCLERCMEANAFDAFKLYPENYLMQDGRIYLTREGDWVSLRTCDTAFMRRTKHTYWATIEGTRSAPSMSFSPGPDRPVEITSYGTSFMDPNTGDIHILGGQKTSAGSLYPVNARSPTHFVGGRGSRKLETFHPSPGGLGGEWKLASENFLGDSPQDDRTMHYTIILPTRQVLVTGGGNFDFYGPVFYPTLMTPTFDAGNNFTGYEMRRMAEALEPRLYHNTAVLLPDGRVFVSGGNSARATVHTGELLPADPGRVGQPLPDLGLVDTDVYFFDDGPMAKFQKGMMATPTEDWVAEIFSPPYLFIDQNRRAAIKGIEPAAAPGYQHKATLGGHTYFLLHSDLKYQVDLDGLPSDCSNDKASLVLIKLPSATHGWQNGQAFVNLPFTVDTAAPTRIQFQAPNAKRANIAPAYYMMFYVDCKGKPSVARMVRFDDAAKQP